MMNILDVCCALIELPSAQGTLLLGAKKKAGQSNGLFYELVIWGILILRF